MSRNQIFLKYVTLLIGNLFYWWGAYFFYKFFLGYGSENIDYVNRFSAFLMPVTIGLTYFLTLYLIPRFLLKRKFGLFLLYAVYTFLISFAAIVISIFYGLLFSSYLKDLETIALTKSFPLIILGVYFVVVVATIIALLYYSYRAHLRNEDLKNKMLQAELQLKEQELSHLKMQIHPHFLFNSLNAIYGMALNHGSETPDMILKLSSLLDYILYQVEKPTAHLKDELKHIKDYLSLEKTRFGEAIQIEYHENLDNLELQLAPMLLLPLIENSIKHGCRSDGVLRIKIGVELIKNKLEFYVGNTAKKGHSRTSGIGLTNLEKRLELLYPNRYKLSNEFDKEYYKAYLTLSFKP